MTNTVQFLMYLSTVLYCFWQSFGLMSLKTGQHSSLELDTKAKIQFDISVNIQ